MERLDARCWNEGGEITATVTRGWVQERERGDDELALALA